MLMKCQGSRIEEQRSSLPANDLSHMGLQPHNIGVGPGGPPEDPTAGINPGGAPQTPPLEAPTVPDEDFFNLIQRLQSGRLEDQRATLKPPK